MKPEIRIIEYKGRNSGFATVDKVLYKLELVSDGMSKLMYSGHNSLVTKNSAIQEAEEWKKLLNWDIKFYKEVEKVSTILIEE